MDSDSVSTPQDALEKPTISALRVVGRPFVKGDPRAGRPRGRKSDALLAAEEFAREVTHSDIYRESVWRRIKADTLPPAIEALLHYYAAGKPKETVEVQGEITVEKIVREVIAVPGDVVEAQLLDAVH